MKVTNFIILGAATVVAAAQPHRHAHRHADVHAAAPVEKRADTTTTVPATVTVYELNGKEVKADQVAEGLANHVYVLLTDDPVTPSTVVPNTVPMSTPTAVASSSTAAGGEFFEVVSSSSTAAPSTSSTPPPTSSSAPSSSSPASSSSAPAAQSSTINAPSSGSGGFPSGQVPCSQFPSQWGAVAAPWIGLGGWTGVQCIPNYTPGGPIDNIVTAVAGGSGCQPGCYCSYACGPGMQKYQWPTVQGSSGQSVGGVLCNSNGFLELSNPNSDELCIPGTGNIWVHSDLNQDCNICRTDYPGTESETVALTVHPGDTDPLTCPDASTYYHWQNSPTSAQYYVNDEGVPVDQACCWNNPGSGKGNFAPMNWGVGKGEDGNTYISMFDNYPTNPKGTELNFDVEITGDVSAECVYKSGQYFMNGNPSPNGCTVQVTGSATYVMKERGSS